MHFHNDPRYYIQIKKIPDIVRPYVANLPLTPWKNISQPTGSTLVIFNALTLPIFSRSLFPNGMPVHAVITVFIGEPIFFGIMSTTKKSFT